MINVLEFSYGIKEKVKQVNELDIILTHGDADGLVGGSLYVATNELFRGITDSNRPYIVLSSLAATSEETDKMIERAADFIFGKSLTYKLPSLPDVIRLIIIDRPSPSLEMLKTIQNISLRTSPLLDKRYLVCEIYDHHESNVEHHKEVMAFLEMSPGKRYINSTPDFCGTRHVWNYMKDMLTEGREYYLDPHRRRGNYEYVLNQLDKLIDGTDDLVRTTNNWDTFLWTDLDAEDEREEAVAIQAADKLLGAQLFWNKVRDRLDDFLKGEIKDVWETLRDDIWLCHDIFNNKLNNEYIRASYQIKPENIIPIKEYNCALLSADPEYQSMLSHQLFLNYDGTIINKPKLDVIIYINATGSISIRSRKDIPVKSNELASIISKTFGYGGGGHPSAAGGRVMAFEDHYKVLKDMVKRGVDSYVYGVQI